MSLIKKTVGYILGMALTCSTASLSAQEEHASHGFVVLGDHEARLYHLARFDSAHEWQGVFKVEMFDKEGQRLELKDLRKSWSPIEVLSFASTDHFDLVTWAYTGSPQNFAGDLYKGYLRSPNKKKIATNVQIKLLKTEYFKKIISADAKSNTTQLILSCDEATNRIFGVHVVHGKPSFEEVVTMKNLFQGSPEECCSRTILCKDFVQGEVANVYGPTKDAPLDPFGSYEIYSKSLRNGAKILDLRRVLLDTQAINVFVKPDQ